MRYTGKCWNCKKPFTPGRIGQEMLMAYIDRILNRSMSKYRPEKVWLCGECAEYVYTRFALFQQMDMSEAKR